MPDLAPEGLKIGPVGVILAAGMPESRVNPGPGCAQSPKYAQGLDLNGPRILPAYQASKYTFARDPIPGYTGSGCDARAQV